MSYTTTYLVTGATRGIGLEYVNQLAQDPSNLVIASARSLSNTGALGDLAAKHKNIQIVELEVGTAGSAEKLPAQINKITDGIDVLIHNAGILQDAFKPVLEAIKDRDNYIQHHVVNVIGAIEVFAAVYPLLLKKSTRKIVFISSVGGSFSEYNSRLPASSYGLSKAGLNFSIVQLTHETAADKPTIIALHPGLVSTDMVSNSLKIAGPNSGLGQIVDNFAITPQTSVSQSLHVINRLTREDNGKFYFYDGSEHAW